MLDRRRLIPALILLAAVLLCTIPFALWESGTRNGEQDHVTFTIGDRSYTLTVEGADIGAPVRSTPDVRLLRTRSVALLPLFEHIEPVDTDDTAPPARKPLGTLTLTLDETEDGTVFYLAAQTDAPIKAVLSTEPGDTLAMRAVAYKAEEVPEARNVRLDHAYDADSGLYFEGKSTHLYLSRLASIRALGQTVYTRTVPDEGVSIMQTEDALQFSIPLPAGRTVLNGAATAQPLVNWEHEDALFNVLNLDASAVDYHPMADGVYLTMPDTYRPHAGEGIHIYRAATAWLLGPCTYDTNGPMFSAIGKSIVYLYMDAVNEDGFIPTVPSSTWLSEEYGIGAGFYDTRFNFDTMKRLMRAETVWNDPEIGKTVRRMLSFYEKFADANAFEIEFRYSTQPFVPDYGHASPDALKPTSAACSLNHYLAEALVLLRAGTAYENESYLERGFAIMDAINVSAGRWIKRNGDLWYAMRPDGEMEKDDYVDVTYLDLVDACALLYKMNHWDGYESIQALLATKEEWLLDHGYDENTMPHGDFTMLY